MALKKPSQQVKRTVTEAEAEALANKLADKPYGSDEKETEKAEKQCRTTISIPESLLVTLEDLARENKRERKDPKSVSAIVREALGMYLFSK
ncbi:MULTISPECIES: CopG family transcriptional regulator [Yersinia]|uniref:CopG family transcriptional regulator n=1 Tax=Yersinia TaxID=629 RepID=UPI0011A393DF|nr:MULTISPECIES: CopG family transcriptional regulator [Yersinia]MBS0057740.1 CopG family transcriptional regulator [Yersinia sp. Marseille-Q3913]